ncbi:MAG: hypothetical protein HZA54_17790 [Planctomycetes bacterium]|nr:hypothetical protein [Planctomycetota bacterium]
MKLSIAQALRPAARIGCLVAEGVHVARRDETLWGQFQMLSRRVREEARSRNLLENGELQKVRKFVKAVGLDPERFLTSAELLLRKALKNLPISQVNSVVDAAAFLALETQLPVSCYDLARLHGPLEFRAGRPEERFDTTTRDKFSAAEVPVLCDERGPFGSPLADAARTAPGNHTHRVLAVVYAGNAVTEATLRRCLEGLAERLAHHSRARVGAPILIVDEAEVG